MKKFIKNQNGAIAISLAIILPFLIFLFWLGIDSSKMLMKKSRLDNAIREANLASVSLENEDDKNEVADNFLRAYFGDENLEILGFENEETQDENKTKDAFSLSAALNSKTDFLPQNLSGEDESGEYRLESKSSVIKGGSGSGANTDYAFALDFSTSMLATGSFERSQIKELCNLGGDEFDAQFCARVASSSSNLNVSQAIIHKILKILAMGSADSVSYSLVPFSILTQAATKYDYTIVSDNKDAKQLITPYVFLRKYRLSNPREYEKYSRPNLSLEGRKFKFEYADEINEEESKKATDLFIKILQAPVLAGLERRVFGVMLNRTLPEILDFEATMANMFNQQGGFGFLLDRQGLRPSMWYYDQINQVLDPHSTISNYARNFIATETPLKPLKAISSYEEEPITEEEDLKTLNAKSENLDHENQRLNLALGLMRGAAHLAKGRHDKRALFLITDGATTGSQSITTLTQIETSFITRGLCKRITDGLISRGAKEAKIYVIVIASKERSERFFNTMKLCTDEENIVFVEKIEDFLSKFKDFALGENQNSKFITIKN